MKILTVIVTYNPVLEDLNRMIKLFDECRDVKHLIVFDNSKFEMPVDDLYSTEKMEYYHSKTNVGLSRAYNYAADKALQMKMDAIMLMDQDSDFMGLGKYIDFAKNNFKDNVIYGPNTSEKEIADRSSETDYVINSGMIVPIAVWKNIGGFCEDFFIDGIDEDFCFKANSHGYLIVKYYNCYLKQVYGNPIRKKILWKEISMMNYSPMRLYGIIRNHIVLLKKYKLSRKTKHTFFKLYFFVIPSRVIIGEQNKQTKVIAMIYGLIDGIFGKPSRIKLFT